jgi:glycosyltransferase involved in cell wall biosynthesis
LNILLVSNLYPPGFIGGYELGAYDLANWLSNEGHVVRVITSNYFDDRLDEDRNHNVIRSLQLTSLKDFNDWESVVEYQQNGKRLFREIEDFSPNLVIAFNLRGLGVASLSVQLASSGVPVIFYMMDDFFKGSRELLSPAIYETLGYLLVKQSSVAFVAMSSNVLSQVENSLGVKVERVLTLPGWAETTKKPLNPVKGRQKGDFGITKFIFTSRIAAHKGIFLILEAAEKLRRDGLQFQIDIFGDGEIQPLLRRIEQLELNENLAYAGNLQKDQMLDKFSDYDFLLFPTWPREPFGFVAAEAAMAGCVPIITSEAGAAEFFIDNLDSIKIEQNLESLYQAMKVACLMNQNLLQSLKKQAKQTAQVFFDKNNVLSSFEEYMVEHVNLSVLKPTESKGKRATYPAVTTFLELSGEQD